MAEKTVKTTKIVKKWKDKKTGEWKSLEIDYAKVADRLKVFWEENPRGQITTEPIFENGKVMFKTSIVKDQKDPYSRKATGHTLGGTTDEKDFEKLESLSVGRALALIGYAGTGEIASAEEMEEFNQYQKNKKLVIIEEATDKLRSAKDIDALKKAWAEIPAEAKLELAELKDEVKESFNKNPEAKNE